MNAQDDSTDNDAPEKRLSWPDLEELTPAPLALADPLKLVRVLYFFDETFITLSETPDETRVLVYYCEGSEYGGDQSSRCLVAAITDEDLAELAALRLSVRAAMLKGLIWLIDVDIRGKPVQVFEINADQLPDDALPLDDVFLGWVDELKHREAEIKRRNAEGDLTPTDEGCGDPPLL